METADRSDFVYIREKILPWWWRPDYGGGLAPSADIGGMYIRNPGIPVTVQDVYLSQAMRFVRGR